MALCLSNIIRVCAVLQCLLRYCHKRCYCTNPSKNDAGRSNFSYDVQRTSVVSTIKASALPELHFQVLALLAYCTEATIAERNGQVVSL